MGKRKAKKDKATKGCREQQEKPQVSAEAINQDIADTLMEFHWFAAGDKMKGRP